MVQLVKKLSLQHQEVFFGQIRGPPKQLIDYFVEGIPSFVGLIETTYPPKEPKT